MSTKKHHFLSAHSSLFLPSHSFSRAHLALSRCMLCHVVLRKTMARRTHLSILVIVTQKSWMSPNRIACKDRHSLLVTSNLTRTMQRLDGGNRFRALRAVHFSVRVVEVQTRVQGGDGTPRAASIQGDRRGCGLHPDSQKAAESPPYRRFLTHKRKTLILARLLK